MKPNIIARINTILSDQLQPGEAIKPTDTLVDDLGADSLDIVEIVMALEEDFEIEIPDVEVMSAGYGYTVGKLYEFIEGKLSR